MDKYEAAVSRGEEAARLLASPIFQQAFDDTRKVLMETLANLPDLRSEEAHDLHRMVKCLAKIEKVIKTHVDTGKLAHKELESRRNILGMRRRA